MPTKPNKEEKIRSLPEKKKFQNNDSKNDPKSWKQNGVKDSLETRIEKMQEMFNKDLEEIKNESINNK